MLQESQNNINMSNPAMMEQPGSKKNLIILVVVLAILVSGIVCLIIFKDSLFAPRSAITGKILNPNCQLNDKSICKFVNNLKEVKSMKFDSTTTANNKKSESVIEMQGEDKMHVVSLVDNKEESDFIFIGNIIYTKDYTDQKWLRLVNESKDSKDNEGVNTKWKNEFEKLGSEDKVTYKLMKKEACGRLTCFKYQAVDVKSSDITEYIWFDSKEYLPRKMSIESKGGINETLFYYESVNITEPSPIKETKETGSSGTTTESVTTPTE